MEKNYLYIGTYYHIGGKELPDDYKVGVTNDLKIRENELGRTKSPIKYLILRAWEIPSLIKRTDVEKLISLVFSNSKYDGCEWYDYDKQEFQDKIVELFDTINSMVMIDDVNFVEVDLDGSNTTMEEKIESTVRKNKKSDWSNLKVVIDGNTIENVVASDTFAESVGVFIDKFTIEDVIKNFGNIIKTSNDDFPDYKQKQSKETRGVFVDCHSSTETKIKQLKKMCDFYNTNCVIEKT